MRTVDFEEVFSANAESLAVFYARHGDASDAPKCHELWVKILESKEWIVMNVGNKGRLGTELVISYYDAGCSYALIAERQRDSGIDNTERRFDEWADLAIEMIGKAVALGFDDLDQISNDTDLEILRGNPKFEAVVDSIK